MTSVLYCDLDGFKAVNDRFGHDVGDELLVAVADRLRQSLRARDLLARLGGDEFAVVVSHNNIVQAEDIAARLLESLQTPFLVSGNVTRIQASIGIAHGTDDATASDLMREADMAMYRAKGLGKNRIMVFEPSLRSETLYRLELEDELRQALAAGHIQLNFQPLVDLVSGKVLGFEALARWEHESFGPVSPARVRAAGRAARPDVAAGQPRDGACCTTRRPTCSRPASRRCPCRSTSPRSRSASRGCWRRCAGSSRTTRTSTWSSSSPSRCCWATTLATTSALEAIA